MAAKRLPRPGDVIRIIKNPARWKELAGEEFVVTQAVYTNGILYSTVGFAWIDRADCEFVRCASDKEYMDALFGALNDEE